MVLCLDGLLYDFEAPKWKFHPKYQEHRWCSLCSMETTIVITAKE